jgi:Fe2+ transport system protein FeoA
MPTITDMLPNQSASIVSISAQNDVRRRLIEMGILPGKNIRFVRVSPFGDPVEIDIEGCHVALRKKEASTVEVSIEGEEV